MFPHYSWSDAPAGHRTNLSLKLKFGRASVAALGMAGQTLRLCLLDKTSPSNSTFSSLAGDGR